MEWKKGKICFLDTETTGLDWTADRIIEIATVLVDISSRTVIEKLQSYVRPYVEDASGYGVTYEIPSEITAINGITSDDILHAPKWSALAPKIIEMMEAADLVCAYNAPFDHRFVFSEFIRSGETSPVKHMATTGSRPNWFDPLVWVRARDAYVKGRGRHQLAVTADRWGVAKGEAHTALGDVETTINIVYKMFDMDMLPDNWDVLLAKQEIFDYQFMSHLLKFLRMRQNPDLKVEDVAYFFGVGESK
jgi:DNA polymerase III epsilon subunit-like protein